MKSWGLLLTTVASVLVTGFLLQGPGWSRTPRPPRRPVITRPVEPTRTASLHARQDQPRHWRDLMMQH
jgi:hypothetical protein